MISFKSLITASVVSLACCGTSTLAAEKHLNVLIVTGQNNHDWIRSTPIIERLLKETDRFDVAVSTTPTKDAPDDAWSDWAPAFKNYDVVLSDYNGKMWPEPVKKDFVNYVSGGGHVVLVHAANNAFGGWTEFEEMAGLLWRGADQGDRLFLDEKLELVRQPKGAGPGGGHGAGHSYQITTRDDQNPIFKDLPKVWMHVSDELYHAQRGPAKNVHILATAFSSKEKGGTGVHEPMVWWIPYGKGKVITLVNGHLGTNDKYPTTYDCAGFRTVLQRSVEWVATDKVTIPRPKDFPTADKISVVPEATK